MPEMAGPRGIIGWTQGEKGLLIQAEKAIYFFDVTTQKTVPIASDLLQSTTDTNYRYTLQNLAPDSTLFYPSNCILTRWHGKTRLILIILVLKKRKTISALRFNDTPTAITPICLLPLPMAKSFNYQKQIHNKYFTIGPLLS
jgi:hypothetical protein